MSEEEWCTMPKKRTIKSSTKVMPDRSPSTLGTESMDVTDLASQSEAVLKAITECKASILKSTYFSFVRASICRVEAGAYYESIIGLGIGRISSMTSQLQLALMISLCESLTELKVANSETCCVFDPVITELDIKVYHELGIPVLSDNSKGKHKATGRTLFFLPHCPYRLYCNVLWANWNNMETAHIFGNSFQSYGLRRAHLHNPSKANSLRNCDDSISSKKGKKSPVCAATPVDPSDTVAILAPYITEINLWPVQSKFTNIISANLGVSQASASTKNVDDSSEGGIEGSKTLFLKEAHVVPALRHLENAVCDMSLMLLKPEDVPEDVMRLRPSEAIIDEAALNDVELF